MGAGNFTNQNDGEIANASDVQQVIDALKGDQVPRNTSGVPTASSGDLGTESLPFKRVHSTVGFFFPGMIMPVHDFNGSVSPGHGWFPCDGTQINETNYEAIYGVGTWATFIGSSALDGKFAPDMTGRYLTGASSTTQDGSNPISPVGNEDSEVNLQHFHGLPNHNHQWYDYQTDALSSTTFNSFGTSITIPEDFKNVGAARAIVANDDNNAGVLSGDLYTSSNSSGNTLNGLSSTQDIRPESIEVKYFIRIV